MIKWFNTKEKSGSASLYQNNITLNTVAMSPLDYAFRVLVGIKDEQDIIIKPVTKNEVESGQLDESGLLKIDVHKSFARIASAQLMRHIADELKLELSKTPLKFETSWENEENVLVIHVKKGA